MSVEDLSSDGQMTPEQKVAADAAVEAWGGEKADNGEPIPDTPPEVLPHVAQGSMDQIEMNIQMAGMISEPGQIEHLDTVGRHFLNEFAGHSDPAVSDRAKKLLVKLDERVSTGPGSKSPSEVLAEMMKNL